MNFNNEKWFYDELNTLFDKKESEDQSRIKKMQRKVNAQMGLGKPFVFTHTNKTFGDVIKIPFSCPDSFRPYAEMDLDNFAGAIQFRLNFKRTHPFLIGPATLESLLDKPVDNYDYITSGKLPFNPLFFEFTEYAPAIIPNVKRSDVNLHGIYLCASPNEGKLNYVFTSFWKDREGEIMGIDLFMNDPRTSLFRGQVTHLSKSNFELDSQNLDRNRYQFIIDTKEGKMHISQSHKKEAALAEALHKNTGQPVDYNRLFDQSLQLDSVKHNAFDIVPSLATNLINYINAHNVTVITRDRNPPLEPGVERPVNKQYSLIKVQDEAYDEPQSTRDGHILTYRLAVRGHNRRLRNEEREIVKVSWITPYIKGPDRAPFYDARHEVTAKKIWAEKLLFAQLHERELKSTNNPGGGK